MNSSIQIYDIECFPNYFLAGFIDKDEDICTTFEIYNIDGLDIFNQAKELIEWIKDKWLIGYNSRFYDNQLIEYLCRIDPKSIDKDTIGLLTDLFLLSSDIINKGKSSYKWDLSFKAIDLMRIGNIDKSLKLCGVDLKMPNIQDLPHPFYKKVEKEELEDIRKYNRNDLLITKALYHELKEPIKMRKELSIEYNLNLMDYSDSGIADRLLSKFYSEYTNQKYWKFKDLRTNRTTISLSEIIDDKIEFSTPEMKKLLERLKNKSISSESLFHERILIGNTYYDMLKGGLHSIRKPEVFKEDQYFILKDADVSSYYPINMISNTIKPEHLDFKFIDILRDITRTRLQAKAINPKSAKAYGLKITINSIFGKMGFSNSWLYDLKAMYSVTINGQLYLLMIIEALEKEGFEVFYANTDGFITKVPKEKEDVYNRICSKWQEYTSFNLEFEHYSKAIIRDVNNYIIKIKDGGIKMKGVFDTERWKSFSKGYEYPIVPISIKKYFIDNIPVEETIETHKDILDFCIAQKAGKMFDIYYYYNDNGTLKKEKQQDTNRYYIGHNGGSLMKETPNKRISLIANQPVCLLNNYNKDKEFSLYNVKFIYYIQEAYKIINELESKQLSLF